MLKYDFLLLVLVWLILLWSKDINILNLDLYLLCEDIFVEVLRVFLIKVWCNVLRCKVVI